MAAWRIKLMVAGILSWLICGCAGFHGRELPQVGFIVKVAQPGTAVACDELAALFSKQTALRINPHRPPALPAGEYCDISLTDTGDNHDEVSLIWDWEGVRIVVRHYGKLGQATPNDRTKHLANELIEITRTRYAGAEVKSFKAYSNPVFGP